MLDSPDMPAAAAGWRARTPVGAADDAAVDQRRAAGGQDPAAPTWGLALSGGGIRSATFCLGLVRALARSGVFTRFDYLSTVSGGGYTGAALGRLFRADVPPARVAAGLVDDKSLALWWLRHNGRFLTPAGARDRLLGTTSYLRSMVATQWEVAVLLGLVACLVVLPHLAMGFGRPFRDAGLLLVLPWWSMLVVTGLAAGATAFAFWLLPQQRNNQPRSRGVASTTSLGLLWLVLGLLLLESWREPSWRGVLVPLALMAVAVLGGWGLARRVPARAPDDARVAFTRWLAGLLAGSLALLAAGAADLASWAVAEQLDRNGVVRLVGGLGTVVVLVLVLWAALPSTQRTVLQATGRHVDLAWVSNALGLVLTAFLAFFWLVVVQWFVFFCPFPHTARALNEGGVLARWLALAGSLGLYVLWTGRNLDYLNRSSLHAFYYSRIARAYVSLGNFGRAAARFAKDPLAPIEHFEPTDAERVGSFVVGDDVLLEDYRPHAHGGPIHLLNVCISQTTDSDTGTYSADRKGVNLTVSALGREIGARLPAPSQLEDDDITLGRWVTLSGVTAGTGAGSFTRSGISALGFMTGARLGYWLKRKVSHIGPLVKYEGLLREWFGSFPGLNSSLLHFSDGGLFDNSGVYALLKRKLALIVAADCSADPTYAYEDLENLIRKARIDLKARIEVLDVPASSLGPALQGFPVELFGTPDTIVPAPGAAFLLLARVHYDDNTTGILLTVKPRRIVHLPVDVAGYSDRDRSFPQQPDGNQFFDEAQWESYCELGQRLGSVLTPDFLARLPLVAAHAAPAPTRSVEPQTEAGMASRRDRIGSLVKQSIGIGAALSAAAAVWQTFETGQSSAKSESSVQAQAVETLLARKSVYDVESNLVENALSDLPNHTDRLLRVVNRVEEFGALHGAALQDAARGIIAEAVGSRCTGLDPGVAAGQETSTVTYFQCAVATAVLAQERGTWARRVLTDYRDNATWRLRPTNWSRCSGASHVTVHQGPADDPARLAALGAQIDRAGVPVQVETGTPLGALEGLTRRPAGSNLQTRAILFAHPHDLACAQQIVADLNESLALQANTAEAVSVPGFRYGLGEMQLALLGPEFKEVDDGSDGSDGNDEPAADASADAGGSDDDAAGLTATPTPNPAPKPAPVPPGSNPPPRPDPDPAMHTGPAPVPAPALAVGGVPATPTGSLRFHARRPVYLQYQGRMTHAQAETVRAALVRESGQALDVARAQRTAGSYGNVVKYFSDDAASDAAATADIVNRAVARLHPRCRLVPGMTPVHASAPADPASLEVWFSPDCQP